MSKDELLQVIEEEICKAQAQTALLVKNLDSGETLLEHEADKSMVSASIIKVPIMLSALELVKEGGYSLHSKFEMPEAAILYDTEVFEYGGGKYTLDELLVWMIINSDNTAANFLIDILTPDRINDFCRRYSLNATRLERKMLDYKAVEAGRNNYTSVKDMELLFCALHNRSILTPGLCDYALSVLKRQRHKKLAMRYIGDEVEAVHKTGALDCLKHDTGIFYLKNTSYYFAAFVSGAPDDGYAARWIGRISALVYEYYKDSK